MLKNYPDGNVKVFFMLHTNKEGQPALTVDDAKEWDEAVKWPKHGMTLLDGDREGNFAYIGGQDAGNAVLQRGFKIYALDVKDYASAVKGALAAK